MEIKIKNMVCPRCIKVVEDELKRLDIEVNQVELGKAQVELGSRKLSEVEEILRKNGFELLEQVEDQIVETIRLTVINQIRKEEQGRKYPLSEIISKTLGKDYSFLSGLFSSICGITIEKYFINQRIEYAKELLIYGEMNNSEIAHKLDYSSSAYFSNQFKSITGFTPTEFKNQTLQNRKSIDSII